VRTRWRTSGAAVLPVVLLLAACAQQDSAARDQRESATSLPIASAPPPFSEAASAASPSEPMPTWDEPSDPAAAYRVLIDKVTYMRAHPSIEMFRQIYASKSRMARARADIEEMIDGGIRVVDGRTVLEEVRLLSKDHDTAFLRVHSREEGWVTVDADGGRIAEPTRCEQFVVELRDRGDGWRIATLIVDDESFRRCEA
jgi:hypothetical protein